MRWAVLFLLVALLLTGCPKKSAAFPCEAHDGIQERTKVYSGQQPSGLYHCQDGWQEIWENGELTEG